MPNLTFGERKFVEYQKGVTGSFYTKLFKLMESADGDNLELLKKSFPEEVDAYKLYCNESGYWDNLKKRYREVIGG